jgi:quercetin dioxygenase-like cupin family protein
MVLSRSGGCLYRLIPSNPGRFTRGEDAMKKLITLASLLAVSIACASSTEKSDDGMVADTAGYLEAPSNAQNWAPMNPADPEGTQGAFVYGDPAKGGTIGALLRFDKAGAGALHKHTGGYHAVVISGVTKHWLAGETEEAAPAHGPGSYWYQAGGEPHGDHCQDDCEVFIFFDEGGFDYTPHEGEGVGTGLNVVAKGALEFGPINPADPDGTAVAVVAGNPGGAGPTGMFMKVQPGSSAGLHSHSIGYHAMVVSGEAEHWLKGTSSPTRFTSGGYWYQPGAQVHNDKCASADPCVLFLAFDGGLDFKPEG